MRSPPRFEAFPWGKKKKYKEKEKEEDADPEKNVNVSLIGDEESEDEEEGQSPFRNDEETDDSKVHVIVYSSEQ